MKRDWHNYEQIRTEEERKGEWLFWLTIFYEFCSISYFEILSYSCISFIEEDKTYQINFLLFLGPGEQGVPYNLIGEEEEKKALFAVNGFNAHVSDKIALDRAIPDIRHPE